MGISYGTKTDLRDDPNHVIAPADKGKLPFRKEHGVREAKKLGAVAYMECSALTQKGLKDVFEKAVMTVLNPPKPRTGKKPLCRII
nr:uncharacterized protein LOC129278732 [Lytechinus pictus]